MTEEPVDLLAALQESMRKAGAAKTARVHARVAFESGGPVPVGEGPPSQGLLQQIEPAKLNSDQDWYREQAAFIETIADHLANGRIPVGQRYGTIQRLVQSVATLAAWQEDDRS